MEITIWIIKIYWFLSIKFNTTLNQIELSIFFNYSTVSLPPYYFCPHLSFFSIKSTLIAGNRSKLKLNRQKITKIYICVSNWRLKTHFPNSVYFWYKIMKMAPQIASVPIPILPSSWAEIKTVIFFKFIIVINAVDNFWIKKTC